MGKAQTRKPQMGLNFEQVWAALMENREQLKETERIVKETTLQMKETDPKFLETDKKFKETDKKISKLGNRIGELIEHLTESNILEKFKTFGYEFTRVSRHHTIDDEQGRYLAEIDLLLENGNCVMVVEVKSLFTRSDVKKHQKRMKTLRSYADKHNDRRKYAGAAAGALFNKDVRQFALDNGMFVIEQTGDSVRICAPEKPYFW
jgi:hypothetical protein